MEAAHQEFEEVQSPFATEPKLFGKWSYNNLRILDQALENYIAVRTVKSRVFVPHTAGRYQLKPFRKASCPIIERVIGGIAFHGRNTGKKVKALRIIGDGMARSTRVSRRAMAARLRNRLAQRKREHGRD